MTARQVPEFRAGGPSDPAPCPLPHARPGKNDSTPVLGVVVPTLNEASSLPRLLTDLSSLRIPFRVVVVDGGSTDGTRREARRLGARVVLSARGRARQMNVGASLLRTPWVLFLHADVRVSERAGQTLVSWLQTADPQDVGTFRFGLCGNHWFWRFIEAGQAIREHVFGLAYGDQGLLVSLDHFRAAGGYPDIPLMEDVVLLKTLRREGRWRRIEARLPSSPRRYQEGGRWRGWVRNTLLISLFAAGVKPERLAALYPARDTGSRRRESEAGAASSRSPEAHGTRPHGPTRDSGFPSPASGDPAPLRDAHDSVLMVFAKVPEAGRVKTRIAAEMGDQEAARIYRRLGRTVVDRVRGGTYRTMVFFDPPGGRTAIERWLGSDGLAFKPQGPGDLGSRLHGAFDEVLRHAPKAVVVGTDAPEVGRHLVEEAFRRLDTNDLVIGPALDGGYYLLGLTAPVPALFVDIPWSTDKVAEVTLDRTRSLGMRVSILPALRDVDTVEDLEACKL